MTPDKVEAALGVLRQLLSDLDAAPDSLISTAVDEVTEALAESRRDAARYRVAIEEILAHHANDNARPKAFYIAAAAMKETPGCELSDAEMDATTDYRGHDPDYDRKETP